jgi:HEAT repeat protein
VTARDAAASVRRLIQAEGSKLRLYAACALLCLGPTDKKALDTLETALKSRYTMTRAEALAVCAEVGPKAKALVGLLAALTADDDDETRVGAATALGAMGPLAEPAVAALEKMLHSRGHKDNAEVHRAAASALANIGKAGIPALLRAIRCPEPTNEAVCAAVSLGKLRQHSAEVVPALIEAVKSACAAVSCPENWRHDDGKPEAPLFRMLARVSIGSQAALALGRLRPNDSEARKALIQLLRVSERPSGKTQSWKKDALQEARVLIAWALMQLER